MTFHVADITADETKQAAIKLWIKGGKVQPLSDVYEGVYRRKMLKLAKTEKRKVRHLQSFVKQQTGKEIGDGVSDAIMTVIVDGSIAAELTRLVSAKLGRNVRPQTVHDRLRGPLMRKGLVTFEKVGPRKVLWSPAAHHIGVTERLDMAIGEVGE